jgi:hypothetical protein
MFTSPSFAELHAELLKDQRFLACWVVLTIFVGHRYQEQGMGAPVETQEEIWAGDLFNRRKEAEDLIGYLESVAGRPSIREDGHAHVLAVDTAYGHGKSFFLRRLDRHLKATEHISAYVDAWVDDLEDQPMVALAATLDSALGPWTKKHGRVADGLTDFKNKAGRVAKIVGIGLAKRGAGFLITQGAAEALGDELAKAKDATKDRAGDALKDGGAGLVEDITTALEPAMTPTMDNRIARFREGQAAIQAMKDSLTSVVQALAQAGMKLPITIIVDELDRCRPTYAIKVLEEIKHLFDVQGVAFVLGLHGRQLGNSVSAAYGQSFDGAAYLRRFFNRRYSLKATSLTALVRHLITQLGIDEARFDHPSVYEPGSRINKATDRPALIASYLDLYGLTARDTFAVMEALQTAMALIGNSHVQLAYLLPLIVTRHLGEDDLLLPDKSSPWEYATHGGFYSSHAPSRYPVKDFLTAVDQAAAMPDNELSRLINQGENFPAGLVVNYGFRDGSNSYHLLQNYRELVSVVARFS